MDYDDRYISVEHGDVRVVVKMDDEGIVVDVYRDSVQEDPVASAWELYTEMGATVTFDPEVCS